MTALFADRLWAAVREKGSPVVVGLDPRPDRLPPPFAALADSDPAAAVTAHHRALLDVVAKHAVAIKPQAAFFEALGPPGSVALADAIECAGISERWMREMPAWLTATERVPKKATM